MCFESDLHLTYLVTPVDSMLALEWRKVHDVLETARNAREDVSLVADLEKIDLSVTRKLGDGQRKGWIKPAGFEHDEQASTLARSM